MSTPTTLGSLSLPSAVMTAAGTAGYGPELAAYGNLADLGAVVVKSLAAFAWSGNPSPRVAASREDMLNAVGLTGPGVSAWREHSLPRLRDRGARVVCSIWGRTVEEFADAARELRGADIVAVEVNASCPNLESASSMFAHSAEATAAITVAAREADLPLWIKLSPNTPALVDIAHAAVEAGAEALTCVNTVLGLSIDLETRRPSLGRGGGGLSGPGILPVALRAVFDVSAALPSTPIIGVGGVSSGEDAIAMIMAGASAVQIGTASFANPRAPWRIQREMEKWLRRHHVSSLDDIRGAAHG